MKIPDISHTPAESPSKVTNPSSAEMMIFSHGEDGVHGFPPDGMEHDVSGACWCEPVEGLASEHGAFDAGDGVLYFEHRGPE